MRYRDWGQVNESTLQDITVRVMDQTSNRKAILVENELWKEYVRQRFSEDAIGVLVNNPLPDRNRGENQDNYDIRCISARTAMETALNQLIDSKTDILMGEIEGSLS